MTGSEMQEVVRIVTDSVMAAVERRISSLGVSVRPATVTQESPLMVRLDGAKTPAPARVSGELSVGSRVLVLSSGTTLSVIGGSDGGDVEVSDLADGFVLPVSKGGTGATSASAACTSLGAAPRSAALMYKGTLSSANNMNSVTEPGIYYVGSSYPSNWCGISWAYVVVIAGSGVIHQLCVGLGPSNYYERHYSGSPATWQSWQRVISPYSLPAATASTRGGVRVGSGLKVSGDVLSVDNGAYVKSTAMSYRSGFSPYSSGQTPTVTRWGAACWLTGAVKPATTFSPGDGVAMFTLPSGFRPATDVRALCQGSSGSKWLLIVFTDGTVNCARYGTTTPDSQVPAGSWLVLNASWPCAS